MKSSREIPRATARGVREGIRFLAIVFCWVSVAIGSATPGRAADQEKAYTIGPEPAWAEPLALPDTEDIPLNQISDGLYSLVWDEQTRVTPREYYGQFVLKILNETGVQQGSEIKLGVDPAYETLELHKVEVLRDGQWQSRLTPEIISVLQRETDMESFLLDGRLTVVIRLTDVRPGDIIRYSFTRRGENPVMKNHFFTSFLVKRSYPLARLRERILAPPGATLEVRNHRTDLSYAKKEHSDGVLYEWEASDLSPVVTESDVPSWVSMYPWVEVSDIASWKDVVDWALPLYDFNQPLPADLEIEIEKLRGLSEEEKVRKALQLAQDNVRYLGAETGENSHKPRPPAVVYTQRLGDCKEKALLLCTVLHRLGIEAHPVLVSFGWRQGIEDSLATPYAFDHVIIQATVQGDVLYLDPTSSYQRGPLRSLSLTDFGRGLVVSEDTIGLTEITPRPESLGRSLIEETLELPDMRSGEDGLLKVHSVFSGRAAELQREQFATTSQQRLQESYLTFYEQTYAGIKAGTPLRMLDREEENIFEIWEEYRIPKIWKPNKQKTNVKVTIYPREIAHFLASPGSAERRFPLKISYPLDMELTTNVKFPENWTVTAEKTQENNKNFRFSQEISGKGKEARLVTKYKSLRDHVPTAELEKYRNDVECASQELGYVFTYTFPSESPGFFRRFLGLWPLLLVFVAAFYFSVVGGLAVWLIGRSRSRKPCPPGARHLDGLGGWLILVGIGVVVRPFSYLMALGQGCLPFFQNPDVWAHFTQAGGAYYSPLWLPIFLFEVAINAMLSIFAIVAIGLFFKKRQIFPLVFVGILTVSLAAAFLDHFMIGLVPKEVVTPEMQVEMNAQVAQGGRGFMAAAIWIPYMFLSRRVKATFRR